MTVTEAVVRDIRARAELGLLKYGTTLDRQDLTTIDWVRHMYEELLDAACYAKRLLKELEDGGA